jgi:parallel beta-helix repeat protein
MTNIGYGIYLDSSSSGNIISGNNITQLSYIGLYIYDSSGNSIFHNNFINPPWVADVYCVPGSVNVWDDGYPSGGNYWTTYVGYFAGVDLCKGLYQNETGSDGIGDTPYFIFESNDADRYPLMKPYPWAADDIGITSVTTSKNVVGQGYNASINVMMLNYGNDTEAFNVTMYANQTLIGEMFNVTLTRGNSAIVSFTWNTTGLAYSNYTINAYAEPVLNETYVADNNVTCIVPVHVGVPGDVSSTAPGTYDGKVDMKDIAYMIILFNTRPNSPNWNPNADVNNDGVCSMKDIAIAILNFNKHE